MIHARGRQTATELSEDSPSDADSLRSASERVRRAWWLGNATLALESFAARDAVVSRVPGLPVSGWREATDADRRAAEAGEATILPGAWDHEHCRICSLKILPGDTWWVEQRHRGSGLCTGCYPFWLDVQAHPRPPALEVPAFVPPGTDTDADWFTSTNPMAMRFHARPKDRRLMRLFACACIREAWHLLADPRSRRAVEVAERYAEGRASDAQLDEAVDAAARLSSSLYVRAEIEGRHDTIIAAPTLRARLDFPTPGDSHEERAYRAASAIVHFGRQFILDRDTGKRVEHGAVFAASRCPSAIHEALASHDELRRAFEAEIERYERLDAPLLATDPFEGAAEINHRDDMDDYRRFADSFYQNARQADLLRCIIGPPSRRATGAPWISFSPSPEARLLAKAIGRERAYGRLPELADRLEREGCCDTLLLDHCRSRGPHARGCWALDAILGRR